ncbi:MAG: hypothetical protein R2757_16085 [Draconibacterium sp.]
MKFQHIYLVPDHNNIHASNLYSNPNGAQLNIPDNWVSTGMQVWNLHFVPQFELLYLKSHHEEQI